MTDRFKRVSLAALLGVLLVSCGGSPEPPKSHTPRREDWVIESRVVVREGPLEPGYRLIVPASIAGIGTFSMSRSFLTPSVDEDGSFRLDLNEGHDALVAELQPADFHFRDKMLETKGSRFAMLDPYVVDRRTKNLGQATWVDADSRLPLDLYYFDRPTRITGGDYNIDVREAGYYWIGASTSPVDEYAVRNPREVVVSFFFRERI